MIRRDKKVRTRLSGTDRESFAIHAIAFQG
jgi:hypothetical protein